MWALLCAAALAGDTWTSVAPGVDWLRRTTTGPSQQISAARVDLSDPRIALHASADLPGVERAVNTLQFARAVDATVAINADWSDGSNPVGLSISGGTMWKSHIRTDAVGGHWGFFACTVGKVCTLDREQPLDVAWWFADPTQPPWRFHHATGANGVVLLRDGVARSGCYDTARNPRSAACVDAAGTTLWLVVVDGRQSGMSGMTCDETRDLLLDLGCWDAVMLDGGGSSTLVVDGEVVNSPSDGRLRTVSNHIGVIVADAVDPACALPNGRWCEGTRLSTCEGGRVTQTGDCAAFGAGCEEDGDFAYCVDPRCPGGSGAAAVCLDGTRFAACADGRFSEGDCGAFGLLCGTGDDGRAACMDPACAAGPDGSFCEDARTIGACTDGVYGAVSCGDSRCAADAAGAFCLDAACPAAEWAVCEGDVRVSCTRGQPLPPEDCAAAGARCVDGACVSPDGGSGAGDGSADARDSAAPAEEGRGTRASAGCQTGGRAPVGLGLGAVFAAWAGRRRRARR